MYDTPQGNQKKLIATKPPRYSKYIRYFYMFDGLSEKFIKTKSIEAKCDECDYVGRNAARVIKHKEVKHVHNCDVCDDEFIGDTTFEKHNRLVHLNSDTLLSEKEFEELDEFEQQDISCGPDTPRKRDFMKRLRKR